MADVIDSARLLFDCGVHLESRTVFIGKINDDDDKDCATTTYMAEKAIKGLLLLDRQSTKPINVIMYNEGGHVTAGQAIYDAIRQCQNTVKMTIYGEASSMGALILQAADKRVIAPNAKIMIHRGTIGFPDDHINSITEHYDHYRKVLMQWEEDVLLHKIEEAKPNITRKQIKDMILFDSVFTAQRALEYGLVDEILVPPEVHEVEEDE